MQQPPTETQGAQEAAAALSPTQDAAVRQSFARQGLMRHWDASIEHLAHGRADIRLPHSERVSQQQGSFHGGAMGALADIAAGYAAMTVAPEGLEVATVEYKINFLAACSGGTLLARGRVVRAGRRIIITAANVVHQADDGRETLCAVMQQTIMPVTKSY
ncbi:Thioesterase superfamily protein [Thiomonas sp. X19]|uniref:PaaI family thioesterase n=1 Tax=Thiomonas sp. X19 TaxID=1050370 RepID=UPI000B6CD988|nr:PaaI family thioesterase [Thiomonas sp. X19]SCC92101.1 Thioesterase superfamily protein [Thiomonas sp. X19]